MVPDEVQRAHLAVARISLEVLCARGPSPRDEREYGASPCHESDEKPPHHRRPTFLAVADERSERCDVSRGAPSTRGSRSKGVRSMNNLTT